MTNLLNLKNDDGEIHLNDERMILTSSSIFGTLRKDLIENIGFERMKSFLIRYGWNIGVNDAKKALKGNLSTVKEILRQGPILHMLQGYTKVNTTKLELSMDSQADVHSVKVEGVWVNSYEAEEHITQTGIAEKPVCYTLTGYASGFYSTVCGHEVIFKESACKGAGQSECRYEGKSIHLWGIEIQDELKYYKTKPIVQELAVTYEKLLEERNSLSKVMDIHNLLTEELINGRSLQSIVRMVYQKTKIPLLMENFNGNQVYHAGFHKGKVSEVRNQLKLMRENGTLTLETGSIVKDGMELLYTPITLQNKTYGYCTFAQSDLVEGNTNLEINRMILERVSMTGSLFLLNEKSSFEALERVKGLFLEQILNGEFASREEIIKKSMYLDASLDHPFTIAVLGYRFSSDRGTENDYFIQQKIIEEIYSFFKKWNQVVLSALRDGNIVLLIPLSPGNEFQFRTKECINHLYTVFSGYNFKMGLSTISDELERAHDVFQEALTALNMNEGTRDIIKFEEVDLLSILMHTGSTPAVLQKAEKMLGPLLMKDDPKMNELLKTLYVFLQCGGNLECSMKELNISMSGLRYRIKRLEELLSCQIRNPKSAFQLYASFETLLKAKMITIG
ncbi:XylR N-terminal domain-containing protein [Peribacillus simplex]|uniref:XylR N-terminal domain-containing protein n=2 Tax=Peribacillus TaxID=2675229 RepID=A0AA90PEJ8_9BACI|nr:MULTISPECIES: XylR N-terminal domain-containing protein [Peribacillus]MDP1418736.1 XylR N-terminal domain-containing protein [Peribacillus simplex]MDP1450790.1 XylR N-terminal domain-containing protein [Peribacillus frigoritolerans]